MKDKDFKETNNYREVAFDSCFNCKYSINIGSQEMDCVKDSMYGSVSIFSICDKWEHE